MILLLITNAFEGFLNGINSGVDQGFYKVKHNYIPPKKVTLIPIVEVNFREIKKEDLVNLIPLDK